MLATRRISIVGGGIAGLSLARALNRSGIPSTIYEKSQPPSPLHVSSTPIENGELLNSLDQRSSRHSYGITLSPATSRSLADLLNIATTQLRHLTAVDGKGIIHFTLPAEEQSFKTSSSQFYRAHLGRLEALLADGLDIKYKTTLDTIKPNASGNGLTLGFTGANNFSLSTDSKTDIVVAADGIHSTLRNHLLPESKPKVLPYVAFHGSRKVSHHDFALSFKTAFHSGGTVLVLRRNEFILSVHLDELPSTPDGDYRISWTYSRPASQGPKDPLYGPSRSNAQAKDIPPEFYEETAKVARLDLEPAFAAIVDPEALKSDRVLHWLLRSFVVGSEPDEYPSAGVGVVFLGDAGHAMPIIGSIGAEVAVEDALVLARIIEERAAEDAQRSITEFYEQLSWSRTAEGLGIGHSKWSNDVLEAEMRLRKMHSEAVAEQETSNLRETEFDTLHDPTLWKPCKKL